MTISITSTIKAAFLTVSTSALLSSTAFAGDFCQNQSDGYYPSPDDCSTYIVCYHNGESQQEMSCPAGLLWSPDGQYCDWPENVSCEAQEPSKKIDLVNYGGLAEFANMGMNVAEMDECVIECDGGYWECACVFDTELDADAECWSAFADDSGFDNTEILTMNQRFALVIEDATVRNDESLMEAVMDASACIEDAGSESDLDEKNPAIAIQKDTIDLINYGGLAEFANMGMNVAEMDECVFECDGGYWECACAFDAELDANAECWSAFERARGFDSSDELSLNIRLEMVIEDAERRDDAPLIEAVQKAQDCLHNE